MTLCFLQPAVRFFRPVLLGAILLTIGVPCAEADTYQRTKAGGDFNDPPDPSHGSGYPWMDETAFGSGTMPGAGDTAIIGSYPDPSSPGGPDGYTLTGDFAVGTLELGNVTLTGSVTATTEMDFGGYGSAVDTLQGGSSSTNKLNGGVNLVGASLMASGDSDVVVTMTGASSLSGTTATNLSGTIDASTASFSGAANVVVNVQNDGKLTTADGSSGGVTVIGGGASWSSTGTSSASIAAQTGGTITTVNASLDGVGTYAGQGAGVEITGAGSTWSNSGHVTMDQVGTDFSVLTVSQGGTINLAGTFGVGNTSGGNGEIFVQDAGSTLSTGALTAPACSVSVTNGGKFTTKGTALLDEQGSSGFSDSGISGSGSLWHAAGDLTLSYGAGTLDLSVATGGLLQVDGNLTLADTILQSNGLLSITGANGLQVGASANIGKVGTGELDIVGDGSTGTVASVAGVLNIGGSAANTTAGAHGTVYVNQSGTLAVNGSGVGIILAPSQLDVGELLVTGKASTAATTGTLVVGADGQGLAGVTLGGTLTAGASAVEPNDLASKGELDVFDPGSVCTLASLDALGYATQTPTPGAATVAVNNYGVLKILTEFAISSGASVYVSTAAPAKTNTSYVYPVTPSDTTHAGGQVFVGTDTYGPDATIRVGHGGTLYGQAKTLMSNVAVGAGGRFKPGDGSGTFAVTGNCDLSDGGAGGGETDIQFGGSETPGTDYDQLIVSGTATLGGTLDVSLEAGYTPVAGDEFHVVQAGAINGSFASIVSPGVVLVPRIEDNELILTVTEVAIGSPPDITSPATATAMVGQAFSYQIVADNAPYQYGATGLPGGLSINTVTGLISGTPTTVGVYTVALAATNSGFEADAVLTLTVLPAPPAGSPVISSVLTTSGPLGVALTYQITASNTPMSFSAIGLPAGLGVNVMTGVISGTPTAAGVFAVTLSATNATGTGTGTLTLTITGPSVPTLTAVATVNVAHVEAGTPGVFTISISSPPSVKTVVKYTLKGSAVNGQDYNTLTGKAKIKPGKTSTTVQVVPRGSNAAGKAVKLVITPSSAFTVGNTAAPKVKIKP